MSVDELPDDGALVEVHWSSVNYKDGLASTPTGKVARISPLVPGVDLAGVLVDDAPGMPAGTAVIAHGYDLGVSRHGGFARLRAGAARLAGRVARRSDGTRGDGGRDRRVHGGDVGDRAAGARRHARRGPGARHRRHRRGRVDGGRHAGRARLRGGGEHRQAGVERLPPRRSARSLVIDRAELAEESARPLESTVWAGAVDCVGGVTLANVLKRIHYGGSVAASGLTGGSGLPTTVLPFILRGVNLLGIDSVMTPIDRRRAVWDRIATDLKPAGLDRIGHDITLDDLDRALSAILERSRRPAAPSSTSTVRSPRRDRFTERSSRRRWVGREQPRD